MHCWRKIKETIRLVPGHLYMQGTAPTSPLTLYIRTIQRKNKFGSIRNRYSFSIIPIGTVHFSMFQMEAGVGSGLVQIQIYINSAEHYCTLHFNAFALVGVGEYFATYMIRSKDYLMGTTWCHMCNWMSNNARFFALNTWTSSQRQKEHHFQVLFGLFQYMHTWTSLAGGIILFHWSIITISML